MDQGKDIAEEESPSSEAEEEDDWVASTPQQSHGNHLNPLFETYKELTSVSNRVQDNSLDYSIERELEMNDMLDVEEANIELVEPLDGIAQQPQQRWA